MTLPTRTAWILLFAALSVVACASLAGAAVVRQGAPALCAGPMDGAFPLGDALPLGNAPPHGGSHGHCGAWISVAQPGLEEREVEAPLAGAPAPGVPAVPRCGQPRLADVPVLAGIPCRVSLHHLAVLFLI